MPNLLQKNLFLNNAKPTQKNLFYTERPERPQPKLLE